MAGHACCANWYSRSCAKTNERRSRDINGLDCRNDKFIIIRPCRFCGTTAREDLTGWRHVVHEFRPRNDTGQACFDLILNAGMGKLNRLGLAQAAVWAALCEYSHSRVS
jgi:hypothetical protein